MTVLGEGNNLVIPPLARMLSISEDSRIPVAPLIGVSERNRKLADNPSVVYAPQGARSPLALARATIRLAALIRKERPKAVLCWMYHAMVVGAVAGPPTRLIADKGYDANSLRRFLADTGAEAVIPPTASRLRPEFMG